MGDEASSNDPVNWLGKIGAILAEKVPGGPLATICLVLVIAVLGSVAILATGAGAVVVVIWLVFVVVLVVVGAWALGQYRQENEDVARVRTLGKVTVKADVFDLANRLDAQERAHLLDVLRRVRVDAAQLLNVDVENVRSNIFGLASSSDLQIVAGLDDNMTKPEERTISLRPGEGSTGIAFLTKEPNIAVLKEDWGRAAVPGTELAKLDPRLRWILSIPVLNVDEAPPICVLNVDGFDDLTAEQLTPLIGRMTTWATFVGLQFAVVLTRKEKEVPR